MPGKVQPIRRDDRAGPNSAERWATLGVKPDARTPPTAAAIVSLNAAEPTEPLGSGAAACNSPLSAIEFLNSGAPKTAADINRICSDLILWKRGLVSDTRIRKLEVLNTIRKLLEGVYHCVKQQQLIVQQDLDLAALAQCVKFIPGNFIPDGYIDLLFAIVAKRPSVKVADFCELLSSMKYLDSKKITTVRTRELERLLDGIRSFTNAERLLKSVAAFFNNLDIDTINPNFVRKLANKIDQLDLNFDTVTIGLLALRTKVKSSNPFKTVIVNKLLEQLNVEDVIATDPEIVKKITLIFQHLVLNFDSDLLNVTVPLLLNLKYPQLSESALAGLTKYLVLMQFNNRTILSPEDKQTIDGSVRFLKGQKSIVRKDGRGRSEMEGQAEQIINRIDKEFSLGEQGFVFQYQVYHDSGIELDIFETKTQTNIELDGATTNHQTPYALQLGKVRDSFLESQGIKVCRIINKEVIVDVAQGLLDFEQALKRIIEDFSLD